MKAKKLWMTGLTVAGLSALALGAKKAADHHKLMKTQEELTAIVRDLFSDMGEIATLYVQVYESSLERLVGGVIFEDGRHYTFVYENEDLVYEEESLMIIPASIEEFAGFVEQDGKKVFLFVADWCGDCRYIYPSLPEIEAENPEFTFIRVDRDEFMDLAKLWDVYGIPSLVVLEKDKEIGRFVNRDRKSKEQINDFLAGLK